MLIEGKPCPECDGYWFFVPYCEKCGWEEPGWFGAQRKRHDKLMNLFRVKGEKDELD